MTNSSATSAVKEPSNTSVKFGISWPLIVGIFAFISVALNQNSLFLGDPDTLMHITAGKWILSHHYVPTIDPFSFNTSGKTWIDHEWLSQIIWASAYNLDGFTAVKILTAGLFAVTLALQLRFILPFVPAIYGLLFSALCFVSLQGHLLARPHLMTWPIIIIWFAKLLNAGAKKSKPPFMLLGLMILWANLHGSFILGLVLLPFIFIDVIIGSNKGTRRQLVISWGSFLFLAILASLITPFGWKGWAFGANLMSSPYITRIDEWAPTSGTTLLVLEIWVMVLLTMGLFGRVRFTLGRLILLLGVFHEAISHVRYVSIFGLLTPLLLAQPFGLAYPNKLKTDHPIDVFLMKLCVPAKKISVFIVIAGVTLLTLFFGGKSSIKLPSNIAPADAIASVKALKLSGNVLNSYVFGGYLIFEGIPVFIDGRADLHGTPENNDFYTFTDSADIEKIRELLDRHRIAWTIFQPTEKTVMYLNTQKEWKKIYEDSNSVVHVRVSQ